MTTIARECVLAVDRLSLWQAKLYEETWCSSLRSSCTSCLLPGSLGCRHYVAFVDSKQSAAVQIAPVIALNSILRIVESAEDDESLSSCSPRWIAKNVHGLHTVRRHLGKGLCEILGCKFRRHVAQPDLIGTDTSSTRRMTLRDVR